MTDHPFPAGIYPILDLDACQKSNRRPEDLALDWSGRGWMPYQLRAKTLDGPGYAALAERLHSVQSRLPGPHHPRIIANDFLEVAWHHSHWFCGIHMGQHDLEGLRPREAEMLHQIRQNGGICGCSTHTAEQFLSALNDFRGGIRRWSYVALGPVFATSSKTHSSDQNQALNIERTLTILQEAIKEKGAGVSREEEAVTVVLIGSMDAARWKALQEAWQGTRDSRALRLSLIPAAIASVNLEESRQAWAELLGQGGAKTGGSEEPSALGSSFSSKATPS